MRACVRACVRARACVCVYTLDKLNASLFTTIRVCFRAENFADLNKMLSSLPVSPSLSFANCEGRTNKREQRVMHVVLILHTCRHLSL